MPPRAWRELRGLKGDPCRQQLGSGSVEMLAERAIAGRAFVRAVLHPRLRPPPRASSEPFLQRLQPGHRSRCECRGDLGGSCGLDTGPRSREKRGPRPSEVQGPGRSAAPKAKEHLPSATACCSTGCPCTLLDSPSRGRLGGASSHQVTLHLGWAGALLGRLSSGPADHRPRSSHHPAGSSRRGQEAPKGHRAGQLELLFP